MDKQMIEEMAKLVQGDMCGDVPCEECNYHGKMKILPRYCRVYLIAEELYNAGYRKIPENAVVMTREKTVDLFDSKASGFMTSAIGDIPLNIDGMRKLVDEVSRLLIVQADLQELNAKYYNEAKDLRRELKQAHKETAEKFAQALENRLDSIDTILHEDNEEEYLSANELGELIDEICKEFTEGKNGN